MKDTFLNNSIKFITTYNVYSNDDIDKLRYGLEGIYLTITKIIIILLLSLLLNILKEVAIVLGLFNIIRFFGFGIHAKKSYQCLISSLFFFILIPLFFINIDISNTTIIIICSICILDYLLFAPADTVKRPLPNKKKRIIRKTMTVLTGIIYSMLIFILNDFFAPLFLSSLVIQAFVVHPLTYKLFRQPFNNYKVYIKA